MQCIFSIRMIVSKLIWQVKWYVSCSSYNKRVLVQKDNHVTWQWK